MAVAEERPLGDRTNLDENSELGGGTGIRAAKRP